MADDLKTQYVVEVLKQGDGAAQVSNDLDRLNATKQKSVSLAQRLGNAYRFLATATIAALLIREIRASIKAFGEQEIAVAKLNGTLRASGQFTEAYSKELQALASSLQQVTRFGDETILGVQQQLVAFGAARQDIPALTEMVLDLAEGTGKTLPEATRALGRALQGQAEGLREFGVQVQLNGTASEKLNANLKQIETQFGGLARGSADTATGQIAQMTNAFGDLREEIGAFLLQEGGALEKTIQLLTQRFQDWQVILQTIREEGLFSGNIGANLLNADLDRGAGGRNALGDVTPANDQAEAAKRIAAAELETGKILESNWSLYRQRDELLVRQEQAYKALLADLNAVSESEVNRTRILREQHEAQLIQQGAMNKLIQLEEYRAKMSTDANQLLLYGVEQFSYGMSNALVNVAQDFDNAGEHIKEFFGQFLAQIGQAILQTIILRSLMGAFGLNAPASVGTGVTAGAQGMMRPNAYAMGGVAKVNQPTVLPRFNALVGEAGPEFLTVLRAPKMLNVGGMLAASGYIGNTGLSLVNTQQLRSKFAEGGVAGQLPGQFSGLAGGGQSGRSEIVIHLSRGLEGQIVAQAVDGARVRIAQDLTEDSDVSRATKRLVA